MNAYPPQAGAYSRALSRAVQGVPVRGLAVTGGLLVGAWALAAIFAPIIAPDNPLTPSAQFLAPPSSGHLLGTDQVGRDILSRLIWGARVSLPLAVLLVAAIVCIGSILGGIAGYFGGAVDFLIMRLADLVFAFPVILLAMAITAALGVGIRNAVIAIAAVAWPSYARVTRSLVASISSMNYVSAARVLGASPQRTLIKDLLPNVVGPILVLATIDIGRGVLLLSAMSFLGLGAQPPAAEWGSMVASGMQYFDKWWVGVFPGLAIFSSVLGFAFIGESLRDALDPKSAWSSRHRG